MRVTLISLTFALVAGCGGLDEELASAQRYCDMRAIYEESQGEHGWPNHDAEKEAMCQKL